MRETIEQHRKGIAFDYDCVVVLGIGGSYLGTRAVYQALTSDYADGNRPAGTKPIYFAGHHVSGQGLADLLALLESKSPMVNVISKTGVTTETAIAFRLVRDWLHKRYGAEAAQRIVVTTDAKDGALRAMAQKQGYASQIVPSDLGGRYSVLTAVGQWPLALAGFDVKALLSGADTLFSELRAADVTVDHPVVEYAAIRQAAYRAGRKVELLTYDNPRLRYLVEWWRQLFGESEGKQGKGLYPDGLALTTDLHSLGQYVQDGERMFLETFLEVAPNKASSDVVVPKAQRSEDDIDELGYLAGKSVDYVNSKVREATLIAHAEGGVDTITLKTPMLDAFGLGALFAFFETSCAVSALLLGVNPFDQPGVEAYKKNLFALLGKTGYEELAKKLQNKTP